MASLTSSSLYGSPMSLSYQASASSSNRSSCSSLQVMCQHCKTANSSEQRSEKFPRRSFAAATLLAVLAESYIVQEAQAARKKPVESLKKEEEDSLSAYDAKLLATYRRKEAMKEAMSKLKEKGNTTQRKTPVLKPGSAPESKSEVVPEAKLEIPGASVAASATQAVKDVVESIVPTSE